MKTAKIKTQTYRLEWMSTSGTWGYSIVEATTPAEAENVVAKMDRVDPAMRPKATHKIDKTTGQMLRIAL
jgi:hypothetical protein